MGIYLNPENVDFQEVLNSKIYVDKSELIQYTNSVLRTTQKYICVSRPRRFGKSMAANMLTAYYSRGCDSRRLFQGLKIATHPDFEKHLNQYNVIHLNMQNFLSKTQTIEQMIALVTKAVGRDLLRAYPDVDYLDKTILTFMLDDIYQDCQVPFIFIIDEWDCIFRSRKNQLEEQTKYLDFLRDLLKDKSYIALAYMTGILPIKKYGEHSAINVFYEYSMTDASPIEEFTGFTEQEVRQLCEQYNMPFSETKKWYDGYIIGHTEGIYNPWSILNYLTDRKLMPYWVNTSSNDLIKLILKNSATVKEKIEQLLRDEEIEVPINLETVIVGIEQNEENIWGLLLGTGYLKVTGVVDLAMGVYKVKIPNYEIKFLFQNIIRDWFNDKVIGNNLNTILKDLVTLKLDEFEQKFRVLVRQMFSFMDVGENTAENFYHAFVLGMLVGLKDSYYVNSNRESGYGRYDIMLEPKDKNGNSFIMEFKVYREEKEKDINDTIENAKKQIEERKYEENLQEKGFTNITKMVFAFKGKEVKMQVV